MYIQLRTHLCVFMRQYLVMIFVASFALMSTFSFAQEVDPPAKKVLIKEANVQKSTTSNAETTTVSKNKVIAGKSSSIQVVLPDPKKAAKNNFDSEKETRLEDLRYKHLWIAYSLVWLIIFFFIRQTWLRSQLVSIRLEEIKSRLVKLEEKGD